MISLTVREACVALEKEGGPKYRAGLSQQTARFPSGMARWRILGRPLKQSRTLVQIRCGQPREGGWLMGQRLVLSPPPTMATTNVSSAKRGRPKKALPAYCCELQKREGVEKCTSAARPVLGPRTATMSWVVSVGGTEVTGVAHAQQLLEGAGAGGVDVVLRRAPPDMPAMGFAMNRRRSCTSRWTTARSSS